MNATGKYDHIYPHSAFFDVCAKSFSHFYKNLIIQQETKNG